MEREIKMTSDGSQTLYVPELDEHYHSVHGAIQESDHVFIDKGIDALFLKEVKVLEVGIGTGLNCLLTALWSDKHQLKVHYTGIDPFPVSEELNKSLNYPSQIKSNKAQEYFDKIVESLWEDPITVHDQFVLTKKEQRIEDFESDQLYDIIYFDAFGPNSQKELWEYHILEKVYRLMSKKGIFVTYCAKGQLKRDLNAIGYNVETLKGPPGKREMTRARKN